MTMPHPDCAGPTVCSRAPSSHRCRSAEAALVVRALVADMDDGAVLHIGARADAHMVHITPDHRARPHRHVIAQHHVADDGAGGVDVDALAEGGDLLWKGRRGGIGVIREFRQEANDTDPE